MFKLVFLTLSISAWISTICCSPVELDLLMPNVAPLNKDTYLCRKFKLDNEQPIYITEFEAKSTKEIAHHILLYACDEVGSEEVWNCGEMSKGSKKDIYKLGPVCKGAKQNIIFAWAMDAPKLVLPKDVAFKLGGDTDKKHLVMQVHYASVEKFLNGGTDKSGLVLKGQTEPVENTAAVYLLETGGYIEPGKKEYFESACELNEDIVMHPFAFRTHAHKLGLVNSGYVVKHNQNGAQDWIEIGRRSPQLPQMFYPATNKMQVKKGDILVGRCTMKNFVERTVYVGATGDDEMCNFYVMYYVKGDKTLENNICLRYGPPYWYLKDFKDSQGRGLDLDKMPLDASKVPVEQEKELSDMDNHHGMHGMHAQSEEDKKDEEIRKLIEIQRLSSKLKTKNLINPMSNENENLSSEQIESNENSDEFETYLNELEREYNLRKLLKKFNLN